MLAIHNDTHFVGVPCVTQASLAMAQFLGKSGSEFQTPLAHGFIADRDTPRGQELFNIPKTKAKTMIKPHSIGDDWLCRNF